MAKKLFIPGPSEVGPEILAALARPQVGHRSAEFQDLYARVQGKLRDFLATRQHIYLSTSSATGLMEGAVRNLVKKRCLNLTCGAFSERWHQITRLNGKEADAIGVEWGEPNTPESLESALMSGKYDVVTAVHSETSTGVLNPLREIAQVVKKHVDVLFVVDAVSSMAVVDIPIDELGLDVVFAGTQKGFGLPSGLTVFTASDRAMARASEVENRGYYFDFLEFEKYHQRKQTPATPSVSHFYALDLRLEKILAMGKEKWFARHLEMAQRTREWAGRHFRVFARRGYESASLTAVDNTRAISVADLQKGLGERGFAISNGYGKLKEKTFRIGHMGDVTLKDLEGLLRAIDDILGLG